MGHKGGASHLKRLPAPWFWPIHTKEYMWAPKPNAGPHPSRFSLPLQLIVRDALGLARTGREVTTILAQGKVRVDGRPRVESNHPVGLMDVVEIPDMNISYRALPVEGKGLTLVRIPKDEAKFKLCKILRKVTTKDGRTQLGLHDGRSLLEPSKEGQTAVEYAANDTLRIGIPAQKILGSVKFDKGNLALVIAGRNMGKSGKIMGLKKATATRPAMVTIDDAAGNRFDTMGDYTFAVGTDKALIKLEASQ